MEKRKRGRSGLRAYIGRRAFRVELIVLLSAALMGRVSIAARVSPFGVAMLAACAIAGLNVHYALFGALVGALLLQQTPQLQSASACLLYYGLLLIGRLWKKRAERFEKLLLLLVSQIALMPVFYRDGLDELILGIISLTVALLSALVMQNAARTLKRLDARFVLSDGEQLSMSCCFGLILLSLSDVTAFGFSLCVILLLFYAMLASLARGLAGVAAATSLAVVLMLDGSFSLAFVGGVAACALAGATLRSLDSLGVVGGFVGACLLLGTHVYNASHTINLFNLGVAGVAFLLIPQSVMLRVCSYLDAEKNRERYANRSMRRMREAVSEELTKTAAVCREMAGLYTESAIEKEPTEARMQWIAQAAYGACADCPLKHPCWKDWKHASEAIEGILKALENGERLQPRKPFDPTCSRMQQLASAAWQAQNQYLAQRAMKRQSNRQYGYINRQLSGLSDVVERLAERVKKDKWLDEELETLLMRALDRRGYRIHSADASFPSGRMHLDIRMPASLLNETEAFVAAVERALRKEFRVLDALVDGRSCVLKMEEAQQLSVRMGAAASAICESGVCGDSVGERRMENGRVLYAISDGMGAGAEAKGESDSALRLLFDLYDTGFSRDVALESVNRLLLERRADMYATLDAVYLDLRSGEAEFMKYGAPPSFLARGAHLHEIRSEALPAGIVDEAVPTILKAKLKRNDVLVLLTDGALDALGQDAEEAIRSTLGSTQESAEAARLILERAAQNGQPDDMTVMVIRVA